MVYLATRLVKALIIAQDCMELLLPMAAKKLDLSFDIDRNVPECVLKAFAYGNVKLTRDANRGFC